MTRVRDQAAESPSSTRPVLLAWALAGALVSAPYVAATIAPPPGMTFVGTFHWIDDIHNYVSFVQQAEDGHFLFRNKLLLEERPAVLVNVGWWTTGVLSRALGRRPFLAYRLLALVALAGLLFASDRALRRLGLPQTHRLPALLLVAFGGGLGGLLFQFTDRPAFRCADLAVGYFPYLEALANPHWLLATWLLLETLLAYSAISRPSDIARATALGTALGLVRPYDLVLGGLVAGVAALAASPREGLRRGLALIGLVPVCAYNYWVFYRSGASSTFFPTSAYASPPLADLAWALAPALAVALLILRSPVPDGPLHRQLWVWAAAAVGVVALRPVSFALQFSVGCGLPLLILAGRGLARFRPAATLAAVALLGTTSLVATRIVLTGVHEPWFVPSARRDVAFALRPHCRSGDLAFAPSDIGLYIAALTACHPYSSHSWQPDDAARNATLAAFYTTLAPAERGILVERLGVRHLLLPGDAGETPEAWVGISLFRRTARAGRGTAAISVYSREP